MIRFVLKPQLKLDFVHFKLTNNSSVAHVGRLKMRERKMRYGQNCKGGKCGSGKCDTDKIARVENAGVEKVGVDSRGGKCRSKSYGSPTGDYTEKTSSYM